MCRSILATCLAATAALAFTAPVLAQSPSDQQRFDAALDRLDNEIQAFRAERNRYLASMRNRGRYGGGYGQAGPGGRYYADDRDEGGYDPAQYYRDGPNYRERQLASDDRVYRGTDGRYYCKRNDGTTGLIVGAGAGGVLGNVIDGGHSRTAGTLIGAAIGALAGRSIDQNSGTNANSLRCR